MAPAMPLPPAPGHLTVHLDGRVLGSIKSNLAPAAVSHLRGLKAARLAQLENLTPGEGTGPAAGLPSWTAQLLLKGASVGQLTSFCRAGAKVIPMYGEGEAVPPDMEVVFIPYERGAPYPGIYLFTQVRARGRS